MDKYLTDIEVYKNYFCVGLKDYITKEILFYEISEEKNDLELIVECFNNYKGFLISFNGLHYDEPVLKYLLKNYNRYKNLNYIDITVDLKWFSDKLIHDEFDDLVKEMRYIKTKWISIDLFAYWSKMLRISKKISLKSLGIQLGYHTVQELPYKPDTILTIEDLPKLRYYNYTHDLGILELLCDEMQDQIILRANVVSNYKLQAWSWDAPKIASEALLLDYCNITGKNVYEVRNNKFTKPTLYLNECLEDFDPKFKLDIFKDLFNRILNSKNSFSEDLIVNINNTSIKLTYGIGGLHSVNENEQYYSNDKYQILTSDVASMYPNIIINYNCIRFPEVLNKYKQFGKDKVDGKKEGDKSKETFSKLILNSTSGLLDNQHSWLYYPEGAMKLRLIGQLFLTKCIEECVINNWQVISANTDGIEVIVNRLELDKYKNTIDKVAKEFDLVMEHEYYNKIIYKNVNNYWCITEKGKIKRKGFFKLDFNEDRKREIPLGDSNNEQIIAEALNSYYKDNIPIKEFISNPDKYKSHIYNYCKSNKIAKNYTVLHNNIIQQNLNRYYFSKNSPYLYKKKNDKQTLDNVNVGEGVILFNNYEEKPWEDYKINYNYYISKTQKIIDELNNLNQLTLF